MRIPYPLSSKDHKPLTQTVRHTWVMTGWANYFSLGQVSPAYNAVDRHAIRRLRRWLCLKHKVKSGKYVRFPDTGLHDEYGLTRLSPRTKGLLHAKA